MDRVRAVLFDLDGVLVDACELHRQALNEALAEVGYTITEDEHYGRYNGRPTRVKLQMLTEDKGLPLELHSQVSTRKQELTIELIGKIIKPLAGPFDVVKGLWMRRVAVAVCSNSTRTSVCELLSAAHLLSYVDCLVGNDEGIAAKPAPDLYLEGARKLDIPIDQCVIVEDSPVGLQAAYSANPMRVIKVEGPHQVNLELLYDILGEKH